MSGPYRVTFFDIESAEVRVVEHDTLSRAAQDARTSMNDLDGPYRAEIRDNAGRLLWQSERHPLAVANLS